MRLFTRRVRQTAALATSAFLLGAALIPVLPAGQVFAAGQMSPRKLTMSSQAAGNISTDANGNAVAAGAGGNGAKAKHTFDFTMGTSAATVRSMALQYCTTPFFDTTCTQPTGLSTSTIASIAANSGFGGTAPTLDTSTVANTGTFFATNACSGTSPYRANCILLTRSGAAAFSGTPALNLAFGQGAGTDWITNPTSNGVFYVRITLFSDAAYTTVVDQGAVAGSVNSNIDITAKVQEKLNFSVSGVYSAPSNCSALTGSGLINLGDGNGVLDTQTAYDATSYFRLSTNASGGTLVQYSGDTLKTSSGTNSIAAIGATKIVSTPGTAQFGLGLNSADSNQSLTNLTAATNYNEGNGVINGTPVAKFAFDTSSTTTPVTIASAASGTTVSCDTGSVRYLGNIGTTTKAGVYRTTISYIAVPTF